MFEHAGALALLIGSVLALALAPLLMPDSYSWVSQTTSGSAAQGVEGAWLARLGFLLFGIGAIWTVRIAGKRWPIAARLLLTGFGALMAAAAAFSHRPWETGTPADSTEDLLHSIAATGLGFAFAFGVAGTILCEGFAKRPRTFDLAAIGATILLPLDMSLFPGYDGVLQRLMFLVAYAWFASEIIRTERAARQ